MRSPLAITVTLLLSAAVLAQVPIQPLRRPEEKPGSYSWQAGLEYTPYGESGVGVDQQGFPYEFVRLSHQLSFTISGAIQIASGFKAGVELAHTTTLVNEKRVYLQGSKELSSVNETFGYSVFYEWRLDPQSPWDPRVSLSFGAPWRSGIKLSASLLRDPVVLVGELGLRSREEEPHSWLAMALAAGFVANSWIRLSVSTSLAVPIFGEGIPLGSVGVMMSYAFDPEEKKSVDVRVSLVIEKQTLLSLKVSGRWRGP